MRHVVLERALGAAIAIAVSISTVHANECFSVQERLRFCGEPLGWKPMTIPGASGVIEGFEHTDGGGLVFLFLPWDEAESGDLDMFVDAFTQATRAQSNSVGGEAVFLERFRKTQFDLPGAEMTFIVSDGTDPFVYRNTISYDGTEIAIVSTYRVGTAYQDSDRERHESVLSVLEMEQ